MDPLLVPEDVAAALAARGFVAVAPAGPEGGGWLAAAHDEPGTYVEVHVLPAVLDDDVARRLDALRAVDHPHLCRLLEASQISPGRIALLVEHVPGLTVAEVRTPRVPLSDGEGVTLVVPVLQALTALHSVGLVHGPVTAASVVVRPDGRPVLVDLRGAVLGAGTVDGDVRRWLSTVIAQLPGADVDVLVVPPGGVSLRELLVAATQAEVDVDELVAACFEVAEPEPLMVPDPGLLAGADLARTAGRRSQERRADRARDAQRARRRLRPWSMALVAALVVGAGVWGVLHRADGPAAAAERLAPVAAAERPDPVAAAVALSAARADVIASGRAEGLRAVEVEGGPAHQADAAILRSLAGWEVKGLGIDVRSAAPGPVAGPDEAQVLLRSSVSEHVVVAADGTRRRVAAGAVEDVLLELRWTEHGWRVWAVRPA
jgi:eukaryotic-like serine/threonine-protein kinase